MLRLLFKGRAWATAPVATDFEKNVVDAFLVRATQSSEADIILC